MIYVFGKKGFVANRLKNHFSKKKIKNKFFGSGEIDLTTKIEQKIYLKENSIIIFLSAITPDKGKGIEIFAKNVSMITNLLEILDISKISKFIYVSSDAVYSIKDTRISNISIPRPDDLYGLMHLTRENILKKMFEKKKLLILRPTVMYGIGDTHSSYGPNRFINQICERKNIVLFGKGKDIRDHLYVGDLIKVIYISIKKKNIYGSYVVASGKSHEFVKIANQIIKLIPNSSSIEFLSNNNKVTKRFFNINELKKKFGITPLQISDGIKKYL